MTHRRLVITIGLALGALLAAAPALRAQQLAEKPPAEALGTQLTEKRGEKIPLDLEFTDAQGKPVRLRDYFDGKRPVVLILGYYTCPLLCTVVFNGAQKAFNEVPFTLGDEYRALNVSFDHTNATADAAGRQAAMQAGYKADVPPRAWDFLTSDAANARRLAEAVGYHYVYLPESGEFSHPAAIVVLTPDGTVSNYLYGVSFPAKQLRLALLDAADGKIGGVFDRILLYCYHFDPSANSYTLQAFRVMQVAGVATVVLLGGAIGYLFWSGARRKAALHGPGGRDGETRQTGDTPERGRS